MCPLGDLSASLASDTVDAPSLNKGHERRKREVGLSINNQLS